MPAATQPSALPSEVLMIAESQWLFTESELLQTPSIIEGLTPDKERESRSKGVNFILQVGIMLKLPQITLATASIFLHRFYMRHSLKTFHQYEIGASSLFLATKVEENCRKMKELVIACVRVAQKDPHKNVDEQDREYWRWRDVILYNEDVMLEALCFDLSLDPPYRTLFEHLKRFGEQDNDCLRNAAWAFLNDSYLTVLCLLFPSRTIATGALYAAAKHCEVAFPDDERGRPWWDVVKVDLGEIRRACKYMADVYDGVPSKTGKGGGIYERVRQADDEVNDKTRFAGANVDNTQGSDNYNENGIATSPSESKPDQARDGKRARGIEDETEQTMAHKTNGVFLSGIQETNPQKKQKVENVKPSANGAAHQKEVNGNAAPLKEIAGSPQSEHPGFATQLDDTRLHPDAILKDGGPTLAKPDDVSEEGEVEA